MSIIWLAFKSLQRQGKASIENRVPIYKGTDLIDEMTKILKRGGQYESANTNKKRNR